ncbi:hypothetical protein J7443_00270 [Tropicibacter sp. R15_0]|uniref:hypothetical protein n=1 Tax=Tropicibacter sp. R15_0 TaxID=2821101 RepID=UPI001ADCE124|nr:hypothetical protein [Tropicibacter sp. R15_0]MBO9463651.1 hypothetical protein [Tropicibacter sp. R15_0]
MDQTRLNQELLAAHDRQDTEALVRLYTLAGDRAEMRDDIDAACFYLTHAFVFALESAAVETDELNRRLADYGRAKRLSF